MSLTSAQIVLKAAQIAKAPGMISIVGQELNLALNDLCLHRDLKCNRILTTIAVSGGSFGPFPLAANYLRTYDLFFLQNNIPYFLNPAGQDQYDAEFKDPSIANYPYEYATDLSTATIVATGAGQISIFPQSNFSLSLQHRYMINQPDITTPESSAVIPWFTDQDYLIEATAARMMRITDDSRYDKFTARAEEMLRIHLITGDGDEQQVVKEVRLDPRRFHTFRGIKPTKITGF